MSKTITRVNYNFTEEQQEKFTLYYAYVKENYKSLLDDDIMREKTKNMLAFAVTQSDFDLPDLPEDFKAVEVECTEQLVTKEED